MWGEEGVVHTVGGTAGTWGQRPRGELIGGWKLRYKWGTETEGRADEWDRYWKE